MLQNGVQMGCRVASDLSVVDIVFPSPNVAVVVLRDRAVWVRRDGKVLGSLPTRDLFPCRTWIRIQTREREMGIALTSRGFYLLREDVSIERRDVLRLPGDHGAPVVEIRPKDGESEILRSRVGRLEWAFPARIRRPLEDRRYVADRVLFWLDKKWIAAGVYPRQNRRDGLDDDVFLLVFHGAARRDRDRILWPDEYILGPMPHRLRIEACEGLVLFPECAEEGAWISAVGRPGLRQLVMANLAGDMLGPTRFHAARLRGDALVVAADGQQWRISLRDSTPAVRRAPLQPLAPLSRLSPTLDWAVTVGEDGTPQVVSVMMRGAQEAL